MFKIIKNFDSDITKYLYIFNLFFIIINGSNKITITNPNNMEIIVPFSRINQFKNIKENIDRLKNQFTRKIHLICTKPKMKYIMHLKEKNIEYHEYPFKLYNEIERMTSLSKIFTAHLLSFQVGNYIQNTEDILIMEEDFQLKKNGINKIKEIIKEIKTHFQHNNNNKFIFDCYNFYKFDHDGEQGKSWHNQLIGKVKNGFENNHVYQKNNAMGIQCMYYPKKTIKIIYNCLKKKIIKNIHYIREAVDNQITECARSNNIKILTTKELIGIHRNVGSSWKWNKNCRNNIFCIKSNKNSSTYENDNNNITSLMSVSQ